MGYIFKKIFWKIAVTCHKFFRKLSATCFLWDLKFALHTAYYFNLQISLCEDHHFKKHCSKTNFLFSLSGVRLGLYQLCFVCFWRLTIVTKNSIIDVWQGPKYASVYFLVFELNTGIYVPSRPLKTNHLICTARFIQLYFVANKMSFFDETYFDHIFFFEVFLNGHIFKI